MPDILERLEKFMVYSPAEQNEILGKAQTEIRNQREFVEAHLNEIRRLEKVIAETIAPGEDIMETLSTSPELVAEALPAGDVVRDMTEEEISSAFGSNQVIKEPTIEELQFTLPITEEVGTEISKAEIEVEVQDGQELATNIPDEYYNPTKGKVGSVEESQTIVPERGFEADSFGDNNIGVGHLGEPVNEPTDSGPREDTGRIRQPK
jgi:hypothetical protein